MNTLRHNTNMHKNISILMVLAIFNALAVLILIVGFIVLFKQNPILCFKHVCSNDSYPFEVKGLSIEKVSPAIEVPLEVSPATVVNAVSTPVENKAVIDDFTEKQYIQSLVGTYMNKILLSTEHQNEVKNSPEQQQINALVKTTPFDKHNQDYWNQITTLQSQRTTRLKVEIKETYGNTFCSTSQILTTYKDYCLSLF